MITRFYKILNQDKEVVYVGVTTRTIEYRFGQHIKSKNLDPSKYSVIEFDRIEHQEIKSFEDYYKEHNIVAELEQKYIQEEKDKGSILLNISKGGEWCSDILNKLRREKFIEKYGSYDGFKEYRARIKKINNWVRCWIYVKTRNKIREWLKQWAFHRSENKTKYWLNIWRGTKYNKSKKWVYNWKNVKTMNKSKQWVKSWRSIRKISKVKQFLKNWIVHRKAKKSKLWVANWIRKYNYNKTKNWIKSWKQKYTYNKHKLFIRNWILVRGANKTKNWLKNFIVMKPHNRKKLWVVNWIYSVRKREERRINKNKKEK